MSGESGEGKQGERDANTNPKTQKKPEWCWLWGRGLTGEGDEEAVWDDGDGCV